MVVTKYVLPQICERLPINHIHLMYILKSAATKRLNI